VEQYHWLADAADPKVKAWIEAQNKYARTHLDGIAALPHLRKRLKELMAAGSVSYSGLQQRGNHIFALKADPKKDHPMLVLISPAGKPDTWPVIVDPNALDSKGKTTIDFFAPSHDG